MFSFKVVNIDIYIHVFLGGHNLNTPYAKKLKFGMYPELNLQFCARVAPESCPLVGLGLPYGQRPKGRDICVLWTHV